jgi:hypothetical protein
MLTPISTHVADGIKRLASQYANSSNLINFISSIVTPIQTIEDATATLNTLRSISTATGVQLDLIGTIVGLARPAGDNDALYRQKLYGRIKINTSEGQPEQAIQTYQLFTSAPLVLLQDGAGGDCSIASQYVPANQAEVDFLLGIMEQVLAGGARCTELVSFDATEAFAFDGALPGLGFDNDGAPGSGGKFAQDWVKNGFFAFGGDGVTPDDVTGLGLGSELDPLVGGGFSSV